MISSFSKKSFDDQSSHWRRRIAYREVVEEGEHGHVVAGDDLLGLVDGGEVLHRRAQLLADPSDNGVPAAKQKQNSQQLRSGNREGIGDLQKLLTWSSRRSSPWARRR